MESTPTDDCGNKDKRQKWRLRAVLSFVIPFLVFGFLARNWALDRAVQETERWSHLVKPIQVPMSEQVLPAILWFVGPGLLAGFIGILLYFLFTRCRSY